MNKADFQQLHGFPLETDTLDFMQEAYSYLNNFGYLGGNSIIVQGCIENGNNVSNGVVFFNGELFPFEGGLKGTHVRIVETVEKRFFENGDEKVVYKQRKAIFGTPGVPWQVFQRPRDLWNLTLQQDQIKPKVVPTGAIVMWAGAINQIPAGWKLCDGQNGTPDLRARFVVGYDDREVDYNAIGKTDGRKFVQLTEQQLPKHTPKGTVTIPPHSHTINGAIRSGGTQSNALTNKSNTPHSTISNTGSAGGGTFTANMQEIGGGAAHENRPPYYTLAFIQFKG
ncbi:MAG TPA: hypothetical protein VL022_04905 [Moheibacter sp.]|nr:hypothetical protein [Moheibacter sp.]